MRTLRLKPYDDAERIRRVLLRAYDEINQATAESRFKIEDSIDLMDVLRDISAVSPSEGYLSEWTIDKAGEIIWDPDDDEEELSVEERRRRLAINKDLHSFLRKLRTPDADNLRKALKDCAFGKGNRWNWEVTPSGSIIMPDFEIDAQRQRAAYGSRGGRAKVAKGFAKATPKQRTDAAKKGLYKRWGREVTLTTKIVYLPSNEEYLIENAPARRNGEQADSIQGAILSYFSKALDFSILEKAGLLAIETSAAPSQALEVGEELGELLEKHSPDEDHARRLPVQ